MTGSHEVRGSIPLSSIISELNKFLFFIPATASFPFAFWPWYTYVTHFSRIESVSPSLSTGLDAPVHTHSW